MSGLIREAELREQLLRENAEYRRLAAEHQSYDDQLEDLTQQAFLERRRAVAGKDAEKKETDAERPDVFDGPEEFARRWKPARNRLSEYRRAGAYGRTAADNPDAQSKGNANGTDAYRFIIPDSGTGHPARFTAFSYMAAFLFLILAAFICYFFRNPDPPDTRREQPDRFSRRRQSGQNFPGEDGGEQTISIFLNIFNVHVNRSPIRGNLKHSNTSGGSSRSHSTRKLHG